MTEKIIRSGIILAGGRSQRMGSDKASLPFHDKSLLAHVTSTLSKTKDLKEICIVKADGQQLPNDLNAKIPMVIVEDEISNEGPLIGIAAGLKATSADICFIVAVDMPWIQQSLLSYLSHILETAITKQSEKNILWVLPESSHPQPLCSVMHRNALPIIEEAIDNCVRAPGRLIKELNAIRVPREEWITYDPDELSFRDLDTPADLEKALKEKD
jgi:molybdopterin-guanine dinucleotide biosynthesis protein A